MLPSVKAFFDNFYPIPGAAGPALKNGAIINILNVIT
jgi:hypothetical protein